MTKKKTQKHTEANTQPKLPTLVTLNNEILSELTGMISMMPIVYAQKLIEKGTPSTFPLKGDEERTVVPLKYLDELASYLRILPLFMSGQLYTSVQMDVLEYKAGEETKENTVKETVTRNINKEADGDIPKEDKSK